MENQEADSFSRCQTTQQDIYSLIENVRGKIRLGGTHTQDEILRIEESFGILITEEFVAFLKELGAVWSEELSIFGLGNPDEVGLTLPDAILMLRLSSNSVPYGIIPVEDLGEGCFACLLLGDKREEHAKVVGYDIADPQPIDELPTIANCFNDYLFSRLSCLVEEGIGIDQQHIDRGWDVLEQHVMNYHQEFNYSHSAGGKLPRNHDWRPYRFCIQDVLFGITAIKHAREGNYLEVDVFLTAEVPEYGPLAGARALAAFLLSEAYKCGGTMRIVFSENVERGRVPIELQQLAAQSGLEFSDAAEGSISPDEAKLLYLELTNFSSEFRDKIRGLEEAGRVRLVRACYVVNHGVWSKEQVEMIVLGSEHPDRILGGFARPNQRHLYHHDLLHARAAILGDMLDRTLAQREKVEGDVTYELEDDVRRLSVSFDGDRYAKVYKCEEEVPIPWLYADHKPVEVSGGMPFNVLVRARDVTDMRLHLESDLIQASRLRDESNQPTLLLLARDFLELAPDFQHHINKIAENEKIGLMVSPESVLNYDSEALEKLARSRILRQ